MQDKVTLLRNKWAEALESGEYKQCVGLYRRGEENCAVGLGIKIANSLGFKEYIDERDNHYFGVRFRRDMGVTNSVMGDNDRRMSFSEIAAKLRNGEYDVR